MAKIVKFQNGKFGVRRWAWSWWDYRFLSSGDWEIRIWWSDRFVKNGWFDTYEDAEYALNKWIAYGKPDNYDTLADLGTPVEKPIIAGYQPVSNGINNPVPPGAE